MKNKICMYVSIVVLVLLAGPGQTHHSVPVNYEVGTEISVTGIIKETLFRNPHSAIVLLVSKPDGRVEEWLAEMNSKNSMIRRGFSIDQFIAGESLTVTGWKGRRERTVYFRKGILEDGSELTWVSGDRPVSEAQ